MCGILVDAMILFVVMRLLLGEDAPDFYVIVFVAAGIATANFVCQLGMGLTLGEFGVWASIPFVVLADGLILMYFCQLSLRDAAISVTTLFVCKIALALFLLSLM